MKIAAWFDLLTAEHTYLNEPLALHYASRISRAANSAVLICRMKGVSVFWAKGLSSWFPPTQPNLTRVARQMASGEDHGYAPAAPPPRLRVSWKLKLVRSSQLSERDSKRIVESILQCCHGVIDPLGFALENFDAVGRWQDIDRMARTPIDRFGVMADGPYGSPVALRSAILARPEQFVQTFTEKLMTFGLGRVCRVSRYANNQADRARSCSG